MNESKKHPKTCETCYYFLYGYENNNIIAYCNLHNKETKINSNCEEYILTYAKNKYTLCSSSECIDCEYFSKLFHYCKIRNKKE